MDFCNFRLITNDGFWRTEKKRLQNKDGVCSTRTEKYLWTSKTFLQAIHIHKRQVRWKPRPLQACFSWSVESSCRSTIDTFHLATAYWYIQSPRNVYEWIEHPFFYKAICRCKAIHAGKARSAWPSSQTGKIRLPISSRHLHGFKVEQLNRRLTSDVWIWLFTLSKLKYNYRGYSEL